MENDGAQPSPRPEQGPGEDFRAHVKSARADIERQLEATRAQLEATNDRITARTGRNLVFAISIGLVLGLAMLVSLVFIKELFMLFAVVIVAFTTLELAEALRGTGRSIPRIPTVIAAVSIVPATWYFGAAGQWLALLGGVLFVALCRAALQVSEKRRTSVAILMADAGSGTFIQVYVTFLASFAVLLTRQEGGEWWTLAFLLLVIGADTGAYASGLSFGKHPMAPTISPKKTWEGFAGAAAVAVIAGILLALFMLGQPWWVGLILGVAILLSATLGDLAESLIKRDIGVKDMSSRLPGHGGFLDRLDSILPSAVVAYCLFLIFA